MTKKLLVVAMVASGIVGFSGLAKADSSSVTIYGYLNPDFGFAKTTGATAIGSTVSSLSPAASGVNLPSRSEVNANVTLLGFSGSEDLGGGLKATFQLEDGILVDTGGRYQRNSKVGIAGGFGEVWLGFWNTPMKEITYGTILMDPLGAENVSSGESIMGSPGFNKGNSAWGSNGGTWGSSNGPVNANFDLYGANGVNYRTANLGGFVGQFQYSANEGKGRASPAGGGNTIDPSMLSGAILYNVDPVAVSFAYEEHKDQFGIFAINGAPNGATSAKDKAYRINGGFKFGTGTIISAAYERLDYKSSGSISNVTNYKRNAWQIGGSQTFGPHTLHARFNKADPGSCDRVGGGCSTTNLGAKMYALGYDYSLSKRTSLFAYYAKIDNESSAQYSFSFGSTIAGGAAVGANSEAAGVGIRTGF